MYSLAQFQGPLVVKSGILDLIQPESGRTREKPDIPFKDFLDKIRVKNQKNENRMDPVEKKKSEFTPVNPNPLRQSKAQMERGKNSVSDENPDEKAQALHENKGEDESSFEVKPMDSLLQLKLEVLQVISENEGQTVTEESASLGEDIEISEINELGLLGENLESNPVESEFIQTLEEKNLINLQNNGLFNQDMVKKFEELQLEVEEKLNSLLKWVEKDGLNPSEVSEVGEEVQEILAELEKLEGPSPIKEDVDSELSIENLDLDEGAQVLKENPKLTEMKAQELDSQKILQKGDTNEDLQKVKTSEVDLKPKGKGPIGESPVEAPRESYEGLKYNQSEVPSKREPSLEMKGEMDPVNGDELSDELKGMNPKLESIDSRVNESQTQKKNSSHESFAAENNLFGKLSSKNPVGTKSELNLPPGDKNDPLAHGVSASEKEIPQGIKMKAVRQAVRPMVIQNQVINEIVKKAALQKYADGKMVLTLKLNPEHLGQMNIEVTSQKGALSAKLLVDKGETKEVLEKMKGEMLERLSEMGMAFQSLDVDIRGQGGDKDSHSDNPHFNRRGLEGRSFEDFLSEKQEEVTQVLSEKEVDVYI